MVRLPWLIRTRFLSLGNSFDSSRKQIFKDILGFFHIYHENVCFVYSLESSHRGGSNAFTQHTIIVWEIENK